jgi:hypothetical protein
MAEFFHFITFIYYKVKLVMFNTFKGLRGDGGGDGDGWWILDAGYGLRVTGYGLRVAGCGLAVLNFEP